MSASKYLSWKDYPRKKRHANNPSHILTNFSVLLRAWAESMNPILLCITVNMNGLSFFQLNSSSTQRQSLEQWEVLGRRGNSVTNCLPLQITEQNHWCSPDWISYGNEDALQSWLLDQIKQLVPTERWDQLSPKIKSSVWKYCHDCRQITQREFHKIGNQSNCKVIILDLPHIASLSFFLGTLSGSFFDARVQDTGIAHFFLKESW